ncbi:MAG: DUF29 domain-containing protein [Methylomonas sp.]|jgi:hypothetical protein
MQSYETDVIAWANEQAALIRAGQFDMLDLEHIADEIEDVGKSELRELESRMAVLLAHLLKWQYQPTHRGVSWEVTIKTQRKNITRRLQRTPSLKSTMDADDFWLEIWDDAVDIATKESGISSFPEYCPWSFEQIMNFEFWPE